MRPFPLHCNVHAVGRALIATASAAAVSSALEQLFDNTTLASHQLGVPVIAFSFPAAVTFTGVPRAPPLPQAPLLKSPQTPTALKSPPLMPLSSLPPPSPSPLVPASSPPLPCAPPSSDQETGRRLGHPSPAKICETTSLRGRPGGILPLAIGISGGGLALLALLGMLLRRRHLRKPIVQGVLQAKGISMTALPASAAVDVTIT